MRHYLETFPPYMAGYFMTLWWRQFRPRFPPGFFQPNFTSVRLRSAASLTEGRTVALLFFFFLLSRPPFCRGCPALPFPSPNFFLIAPYVTLAHLSKIVYHPSSYLPYSNLPLSTMKDATFFRRLLHPKSTISPPFSP